MIQPDTGAFIHANPEAVLRRVFFMDFTILIFLINSTHIYCARYWSKSHQQSVPTMECSLTILY